MTPNEQRQLILFAYPDRGEPYLPSFDTTTAEFERAVREAWLNIDGYGGACAEHYFFDGDQVEPSEWRYSFQVLLFDKWEESTSNVSRPDALFKRTIQYLNSKTTTPSSRRAPLRPSHPNRASGSGGAREG